MNSAKQALVKQKNVSMEVQLDVNRIEKEKVFWGWWFPIAALVSNDSLCSGSV